MTARLASHMLVSLLIRRAQEEGGFAAILRKGDANSGVILIQVLEKGVESGLFERVPDMHGHYQITPIATQYWGDSQGMTQYIDRRVKSDPDLWLVELDISQPQQFIAQIYNAS